MLCMARRMLCELCDLAVLYTPYDMSFVYTNVCIEEEGAKHSIQASARSFPGHDRTEWRQLPAVDRGFSRRVHSVTTCTIAVH
jgi:hypothetical protein